MRPSELLCDGWSFTCDKKPATDTWVDVTTIRGQFGRGYLLGADARSWQLTLEDGAHYVVSTKSHPMFPALWRPMKTLRLGSPLYPEPLLPLHQDNLDCLSKLEAQGWQGTDASLATSLFEYGFAWRWIDPTMNPDGDELLTIHKVPGQRGGFDRNGFSKYLDLRKEWGWAFTEENEKSFLDTMGMTREEFDEQELPRRICDLFQYHGSENIFGCCATFFIDEYN